MRRFTPLMIERRRGHIVNVTSVAGRVHSPGLATYVASKHAATGFSRSVREEVLQYGVSVTAVLPSAVRTMHEIDRVSRRDYDARTSMQLEGAAKS